MSIAPEWYVRYRQLIHEAAKFGVVGVIGFLVTDVGTNLLRELGGLDWLAANTIATIAAIAVTYIGSRYWTFRHRVRTDVRRETLAFFGLAGVGLLIQLACLGFTTHTLGETGRVAANMALLVGIVLGTLFRFWSYRKWVWRAPVIEVLEHEAGAGLLRSHRVTVKADSGPCPAHRRD